MFKRKKSKNVNFLLHNKFYRKLHLILYFLTILIIVLIYFTLLFFFHNSPIISIIVALISFSVGVFLVFKRDEIVQKISDVYNDHQRKKMKFENKEGLKSTIRRIVPRNKRLTLNIKGKIPLKERLSKLRDKLRKNPKKKMPDYIEIED